MFLQSRRLSIDLSTLDICFLDKGKRLFAPTFLRAPTLSEIPAEDPCVWNGSWRENLDPAARLLGGDYQDERFFF